MLNFFENKAAFVATFSTFALAFAWNLTQGVTPVADHLLLRIQPATVAHGPMVPPDPLPGGNVIVVAHGPMVPPDPLPGGNVIVAHGPMVPPDPLPGGNAIVA